LLLLLALHVGWTTLVVAEEQATPSRSPLLSVRNEPVALSGVVVDDAGPVAGASVRVQTTEITALTDEKGAFILTGLTGSAPVTVTAWSEGYTIGWTTGAPGAKPITITLAAHHTTDNHEYGWFESEEGEGSAACGVCHTAYAEWAQDAHAQSATNPRFLSMYRGADLHGNKSQAPAKDNLGVPLPPDLDKPYYGPGFMLDNPNRAGNCATCHTPVAAKMPNVQNCGWSGCHASTTSANAYQILDPGVFPLDLTGDAGEGISCEFCHKTGEVRISKKTGLPYEDMPGILSMRLYRPSEGEDLFFGTLDDVVRTDLEQPRDTYLPLMEESEFCAGCHHGVMGGVVGNMQVTGGVLIYSSYSEWLDSPYSDPETGQSCQDCHMPASDSDSAYVVFPAKGGIARPGSQVHNHQMPGANDADFLQNAVTLTATASITTSVTTRGTAQRRQALVEITLVNDQTGHHVPTDSPLRHMILVVRATDAAGKALSLESGPLLPDWAGDLADQPGKTFAKVLQDEWTGETPTGAYWRPVKVVEDTRLPALGVDASRYRFDLPTGVPASDEPVTIEVQLIYRRAYQQLMEWKSWTDPDIVMEEQTLQLFPE
jgi:hypothetical protein